MFSKLAVVFVSTLALVSQVSASQPSQCNTGTLTCCKSVQSASDPSTAQLLGLLGIVVQGVDALVGLNCNPIGVIGINGNSCTAQPVCCTDNKFNGLVAVGCTPINANV